MSKSKGNKIIKSTPKVNALGVDELKIIIDGLQNDIDELTEINIELNKKNELIEIIICITNGYFRGNQPNTVLEVTKKEYLALSKQGIVRMK